LNRSSEERHDERFGSNLAVHWHSYFVFCGRFSSRYIIHVDSNGQQQSVDDCCINQGVSFVQYRKLDCHMFSVQRN
jgi:hypothetical protein